MRLAICTKRDIHGSLILNWLLPRLAGHTLVIFLSDKTRANEENVPELAELKLIERDIPLQMLFPLLDRSPPHKQPGELLTFAGIAQRHNAPLHTIQQINDGDGAALLQAFKPDLLLSVRFSLIFKQATLDLPRYGAFNVHPGALPRYGGLFAPMRGLLAGDTRLGCTLHRMDTGIDSGPIYRIANLDVDVRRSLFWHVAGLYPLGLAHFLELLDTLERGGAIALTPQDVSQREYRSMPGDEDFANFRARGGCLVNSTDYLELLDKYMPPTGSIA